MRLTFEPILEEQRLAAPCDHASTVEVHNSWYESFQFWRQVKVELYIESADTRVCDCFHFFQLLMLQNEEGLKCRGLKQDIGSTNRRSSISIVCKR